MFFENHCSSTLDTSLKPNAITYLDHIPEGWKEIILSDLPQFRDLDKPDQWEEFADLLEKTAYPSSAKGVNGIRLFNILEKIGQIEVLDLEQGAPIKN